MSGLERKNISKSYKDNKVLDNVKLNNEQGKIYGLIGRNGVGKTTLMSIMTGQNPGQRRSYIQCTACVGKCRGVKTYMLFKRD